MKKSLFIFLLINQLFKIDIIAQQVQSPLDISFKKYLK